MEYSRKKHGFPGGSMQKDGKFQLGVHGKFDINLGGKLQKNLQQGGALFFLEKPISRKILSVPGHLSHF